MSAVEGTYPEPEQEAKTTDQLLAELLASQAEMRAELASQRQANEELKQQLSSPRAAPADLNPQQALEARLKELADNPYYCPACGKVYKYLTECRGKGEAPHPPVLVVSTEEVQNRPDPVNDPVGYAEWEKGHTAAPTVAGA